MYKNRYITFGLDKIFVATYLNFTYQLKISFIF